MTDLEPQRAEPVPPPPRPVGVELLRAQAAPLAALLARLRARAARHERLRFALAGASVAAGLLLVAAVLLVLKQEWARTAGWFGAALALAAGAVVGVLRGRQAMVDDEAAARALGRVAPAEASDLLSAVQLARALEADEALLSQALVRAHVARMGAVAAALDERPALPLRPVALAAGGLALALAVHGLVVLLGGTRVRDAYRFLAFRAAAEASALFAPEPIAGDVTLTYRYPAHMNRPNRTVAGTAGDISAPKGTLVELTARADRDVEKAFAVVGPDALPLTVKGRELAGRLLVSEAGEWRLRYATEGGRLVAEGPPRPVTLEPDQFPEVKLGKPAAELEIEGRETITLEYAASDDYGLGGLELVYSLGKGAPEVRKAVATFTDVPRRQRGDFHWDLSVLDLKPGDRVTYRVEATDNDTVGGPKKGASSTQVLKVFSETEHHREVLKKAEEQWERLVAGMGDRLEEPGAGDRGEKADAPWEKATGAKDELLALVATDMRKLARELAVDKRAPPEIGRALQHVGDRVGAAVQRTAIIRKNLVRKPVPPVARQFRGALAGEVDEEEKGVLYLEDLIDRRKILDLAELARELQQGRQELSRLVEQYKKAPNEETKRQVLGEVARLKERLADVYKRMRELQKGIQDEHLNEEADRLVQGGEDMMSQLDEVQKELSKGNADKALESLDKLQKQLEKMEKELRDQAGEVDEETKELTRKLQQVASDLRDVEADQRQLRQKTEELRSREREAQKQKVQQLGKEFVDKQKERVKRARSELGGVDDKLAEQLAIDEQLQGAEDRLSQLDQALETGDFDEALDQVNQAVQRGQELKQRLDAERESSRMFPGRAEDPQALEQSAERINRAARPMREVADDLEKLMKSARQPPTDQERQQLKELSQRQAALQKKTEGVQQQLDEVGKQMPIFGPGQQRMLQEAAGQMGEARDQLGQGDPRGASGRQQDALQKLQQFEEAMRAQQQGSQGGGVPMPFGTGSGAGGNEGSDGEAEEHEKVEIPGADQSKAPAEFREELLKAMKDETPERYRERVRDYYEELVK